jgi:hypothetical protein
MSSNGLVFTHFQLLEQNPAMQLGQCAMHFDMTRGPNDDAGNPLLVWGLVDDWDSKGYYEHQAKGYAKRYVGGGVVDHAVLTSAERERIQGTVTPGCGKSSQDTREGEIKCC